MFCTDMHIESIFRFYNEATIIATISRMIWYVQRVNMSSQVSFISALLSTYCATPFSILRPAHHGQYLFFNGVGYI